MDILTKLGVLIPTCDYQLQENDIIIIEPHPDDFALSALAYAIGTYNMTVFDD